MNLEKNQIYLHIGYHKTGTTFLQRNIFSKLVNIDYLNASSNFKSLIGKQNTMLISNESFSGLIYTGKKKERYFDQFKSNVNYLKRVFPECKIILGLREPSSLLKSFYKQHLQEGGVLTFEQFFNMGNTGLIKLEDLCFDKHIQYLTEVFRKEELFIFNFEEIKAIKTNHFLEKLLKFIGSDMSKEVFDLDTRENRSVPDNLEKLLKNLNKVDAKLKRFGLSLNSSLMRKLKIHPRGLCQDFLPRFIKRKEKRDLIFVTDYYRSNWNSVLTMIKIYE